MKLIITKDDDMLFSRKALETLGPCVHAMYHKRVKTIALMRSECHVEGLTDENGNRIEGIFFRLAEQMEWALDGVYGVEITGELYDDVTVIFDLTLADAIGNRKPLRGNRRATITDMGLTDFQIKEIVSEYRRMVAEPGPTSLVALLVESLFPAFQRTMLNMGVTEEYHHLREMVLSDLSDQEVARLLVTK